MKINPPVAHSVTACAVIPITALLAVSQGAYGQRKKLPEIPVGWIDAYPTIVHTGTHPTIRWGINFPAEVMNVIDIRDFSTVVAKEEISIEVRVLGNGVTSKSSNGSGQSVPAEALISFNGSSYQQVFLGTSKDVKPDTVVWRRSDVKKGESIRFGGRSQGETKWGPTQTSGSGTKNIRTLVNGDVAPIFRPSGGISPVQDFIKPYLGLDGRVNIGPMDVIVFMELTHSDGEMENPGYDMQDLVLICTVIPKTKTNNRSGLGDGTNPGQGNQMGNNDGTDNPNQAGE